MSLGSTAATIKLCLGDLSEPLYRALLSEINQKGAPAKGTVDLSLEGGCLVLQLKSGDLSGLRALLTSYMYLIHAAYSVVVRINGRRPSNERPTAKS